MTTMHPRTAFYLSEISVSNTKVEDMDAALVTSGACINNQACFKTALSRDSVHKG